MASQDRTIRIASFAIAGIALGIVPFILFFLNRPFPDKGKVGMAEGYLKWLDEKVLPTYKSKFGEYPKTLDQLLNPPDNGKPYVESIIDLWGVPFQYDLPGRSTKVKSPLSGPSIQRTARRSETGNSRLPGGTTSTAR